MRALSFAVLSLLALSVRAELRELDDEQMSGVQGAGFGFVLEQVLLDASGSQTVINDITRSNGSTTENMPIRVSELYLGASGSNKGANLQPVTLGRLSHPFSLGLEKGEEMRTLSETYALQSKQVTEGGTTRTVQYWAPTGTNQWVQTTPDNIAVLGLNFPERLQSGGGACVSGYAPAGSNCSSRPSERADLGIRLDFEVVKNSRADVLNIDFGELTMDGSYLRLWGANLYDRDEQRQRNLLVSETRINLFAKTFDISACTRGSGQADCTPSAALAGTVYTTNSFANIALGFGKLQPLMLGVSSDGQFVIKAQSPVDPALPQAQRNAIAAEYYATVPRTTLVFDNLNVGLGRPPAGGFPSMPAGASGVGAGGLPSGGYNFGRNEISGLTINYIKVTSHDLR
ncbi:hypothetical protein [Zestomonas carbonaria]|uniref:Uncharacterized protein n=1 Tax=Zestomonas carbonaria TaxID=2762745 RepID=A0A7U7EMQ9_9GAMM|nr:hypothetical protein [Pseudomonas carbonaria]CAD5107883.1 hypothetical protein PSEWESI4_02163 [Pseudomonas carbonaria]